MKRFILFAILIAFSAVSFAQLPTRTKVLPTFNAGSQSAFGVNGYTVGGGVADTLAVTDTLQYIYPVSNTTRYLPFVSLQWTKIGAGTATVTAAFYQGNTNGNLTTVKSGSANTAYTKTLTFSATGVNYIDLLADSCKISGNFLGIRFFTSNTASVQGTIAGTVKTAIQ